jgi:hypothetical protein
MSNLSKSLFLELILGRNLKQRLLLQRSLLASGICICALILDAFATRDGLMTAHQIAMLTGFSVAGIAAFYLIIRSGLNIRFGKMSSLTYPQQIFAMTIIVWTFAIAGPIRGAVVGLLVLISIFGVFAFRPLAMLGLVLLALLMLATVMIGLHF